MSSHAAKARLLATATARLIRADAPLYLFILVYTIAGLAFLDWSGASDRAAYVIYIVKWLMLFGFLLPAIALLLDAAVLIHRFERRRGLAARRIFSTQRLARFFSGVALLLSMFLFQGTFTSVKNALSVWQGGFPYDGLLADLDKLLHFGTDPWRWLYAIAGYDWVRIAVEWNYNMLWFVICFGALFHVATSPRAEQVRTRYIFSFMLVWIVVGNLMAGPFMSAGPAFYGLVTGDDGRFAEQLAFLAQGPDWPNSAVGYQRYLWELHAAGLTGFGSGISAFPSVHVGLIALNALFLGEWSRRLGVLAFCYVGFVIASSVYLAWHYAIDGYAAVGVVLLIYFVLKKAFAWRRFADMDTAMAAPEPIRPATAS